MKTSLALVHHANQYLITDGYDNREGIAAVVGSAASGSGLAATLALHRRLHIPLNLHVSGTLLEAIAWHVPAFIDELRAVLAEGLVELVGSCYGQNIMRFFSAEYNRKQLNEELALYKLHLGVDPRDVKVFWPPERVWETKRNAPVLRDARLLNDGYRYVILDDRLLLSPKDPELPRAQYDETNAWSPDLYMMHEIEDGLGLVALPIATRLRRSIPPQADEDWRHVQSELEALLVQAASEESDKSLLAVYADDMEKVSGIGEWGGGGPERYTRFLEWLASNDWIRPVFLTPWAAENAVGGTSRVELGTFAELARDFEAGEGYEKWFLAPDWAPYRGYFNWADARVKEAAENGADPSLIELAEKQLLVGNWETGWHTPSSGPHGDPDKHGHASPWARALTSHSRHAAVTAAAAHWMKHKTAGTHVEQTDIDNDGENEIAIRNQHLFAVVTSRWGGRLVALYHVGGKRGSLVVGNPCDDWNWMEELNKFMEVPRNHPGAFADAGFENDEYAVELLDNGVRLVNVEAGSEAAGLVKEYRLDAGARSLRVRYQLPERLQHLDIECGLSPDYLALLRHGFSLVKPVKRGAARGYRANGVAVWMKPARGKATWQTPAQECFGHGCTLRLRLHEREAEIEMAVTATRVAAAVPAAKEAA